MIDSFFGHLIAFYSNWRFALRKIKEHGLFHAVARGSMYCCTFILVILQIFVSMALAQPPAYKLSNAHSHNDYKQAIPFWLAYNEGFGSIEADIFLENDSLYVAHDTVELKLHKTLEKYYIHPLLAATEKNRGFVYGDSTKHLQLLIDIKTDSIKTLDKLIGLLQHYPQLTNNHSIRFVITGRRPVDRIFDTYPPFIWFDGELFKVYSMKALARIVMMSDDLETYTHWNGQSNITAKVLAKLKAAINKSHRLNKPVRFWNAPDFINAWFQLMRLGVDYINTDRIGSLSSFINSLPVNDPNATGRLQRTNTARKN